MRQNLPIEPVRTRSDEPPDRLMADCGRCFGLCCVALPFSSSSDFAVDKAAGRPCMHLADDFTCREHGRLRTIGFTGCTVYDCFGAGQQVAQVTFGGRSWRENPAAAELMFDVFGVVSELHELLWYLRDASTRPAADPYRPQIEALRASTEALTGLTAQQLLAVDIHSHRASVDRVLQLVSESVRGAEPAAARTAQRDFRRAELIGRRFRGADLRGADFRGALLLGADLRGADLGSADLIGADLRGAMVHGADLSSALFLSRRQVNAAAGDSTTTLPRRLRRPAHWSAEASCGRSPDAGR